MDNNILSFYFASRCGLISASVELVVAMRDQCAGLADELALVCFFHTVVRLFSAVKHLSWRGTAAWQECPGMPKTFGFRSARGLSDCEVVVRYDLNVHLLAPSPKNLLISKIYLPFLLFTSLLHPLYGKFMNRTSVCSSYCVVYIEICNYKSI